MSLKRSVDLNNVQNLLNDDSEPSPKVVLVERETKPGGISLIDPVAVAKRSYLDTMELSEGVSNVNTAMQANARNKLEVIGRQMRHLQDMMIDVFEDTKMSMQLHDVACNFVKKPGHVYHLYKRPSGQQYFGMLSPEEWQNCPHEYLGSFLLEADLSWTPATSDHGRYEGINFIKKMFRGQQHNMALT